MRISSTLVIHSWPTCFREKQRWVIAALERASALHGCWTDIFETVLIHGATKDVVVGARSSMLKSKLLGWRLLLEAHISCLCSNCGFRSSLWTFRLTITKQLEEEKRRYKGQKRQKSSATSAYVSHRVLYLAIPRYTTREARTCEL